MNIKNYIKENKICIKSLQGVLGVSQMTIWRWCCGLVIPRKEMMKKIEKWSHGQVTAKDFY